MEKHQVQDQNAKTFDSIKLQKAFVAYTKELFGEERFNRFLMGLGQPSPVSIRLNPFKLPANVTINEALKPTQIPWCKEGFYLNERPNFTFDPLIHAGAYYVQ